MLYRFYSPSGTLLYVGITASPPDRFRAHSKTKEWWAQVSQVKLEHFESRVELMDAERHAIRTEKPLHNIIHNDVCAPLPFSQERERDWHHLIGQLEDLKYRTGFGCPTIWYHVHRGKYIEARERLDTLLSDWAWFGSAASHDIALISYHSGGQGPCVCGKTALYFRTSCRFIHADGSDCCLRHDDRFLP